jgi:hypothetical protein
MIPCGGGTARDSPPRRCSLLLEFQYAGEAVARPPPIPPGKEYQAKTGETTKANPPSTMPDKNEFGLESIMPNSTLRRNKGAFHDNCREQAISQPILKRGPRRGLLV